MSNYPKTIPGKLTPLRTGDGRKRNELTDLVFGKNKDGGTTSAQKRK